jgi:hypothetical protein
MNEQREIELAATIAGSGLRSVARSLRELQDRHPERFAPVAALLQLDRLDAPFLARLDRVFSDLNVRDDRMMGLGWPKLLMLSDHITSDNRKQLLETAFRVSAKELDQILKKQRPGTMPIVLYLTGEQYEILERAVLNHGGARTRRLGEGIGGKEEALVRALSAKTP